MIRHEENGQVSYAWETHELAQKIEFEKDIVSGDPAALERMITALMKALSAQSLESARAWDAVKELMHPEDRKRDFGYNFLTGKINIQTD